MTPLLLLLVLAGVALGLFIVIGGAILIGRALRDGKKK